ncbi:hypothetical protein Cgig2_024081 [Carnegiea gigantea]|uniref:Uncharacterized protein n=1 Tax=Carnegiea gigantea TaxID=171969 RepID=A0A9Q1K7J6_9CARY|nr:hypothetical protein Cgig2_024081 [Carnegiea gigantea]
MEVALFQIRWWCDMEVEVYHRYPPKLSKTKCEQDGFPSMGCKPAVDRLQDQPCAKLKLFMERHGILVSQYTCTRPLELLRSWIDEKLEDSYIRILRYIEQIKERNIRTIASCIASCPKNTFVQSYTAYSGQHAITNISKIAKSQPSVVVSRVKLALIEVGLSSRGYVITSTGRERNYPKFVHPHIEIKRHKPQSERSMDVPEMVKQYISNNSLRCNKCKQYGYNSRIIERKVCWRLAEAKIHRGKRRTIDRREKSEG